jgi:hypothetical protein
VRQVSRFNEEQIIGLLRQHRGGSEDSRVNPSGSTEQSTLRERFYQME